MERYLESLQVVLDVPFIRRVRRNHGLEHATIHVLSHKIQNLRIVGRSDSKGFWLWGDVSTDDVATAVSMALGRMRGGEHNLAIHPNCGTNLVTTAFLGAAATMVSLTGSEREKGGRFARIPIIMLGLLIASIFGQPLGRKIQKHVTTLGNPGDLEVLDIRPSRKAGMIAHRVETRST